MPIPNHILVVEPEQHYLNYATVVMRDVVDRNRYPNFVIRELRGRDANPESINAAIDEIDPALIVIIGHGAPDAIAVECNALYMAIGDPNAERMRGRGLHFMSCETAKDLGPSLVMYNGALFYFGSRDLLWYYIGSPPGSDRASRTVWLAETTVFDDLCKGKLPSEAEEDRLGRYDSEIAYWTSGGGANHPYASVIRTMLQMDREIAAFEGDGGVRVCSPEGEPVPPRKISASTLAPFAFSAGFFALGLLHKP